MLTIAFNSMLKSVSHKLLQLQSSYLVHICIYMIAAAASQLSDFDLHIID